MLKHAINLAKNKTRDLKIKNKRSPKWRAIEKEFLAQHPVCEICGSNKNLNVHHKKPFHLFPELELDLNNLVTLCMDKNECHLLIGHGGSYKKYCPNIDEYIRKYKEKEMSKDQIIKLAHDNAKL